MVVEVGLLEEGVEGRSGDIEVVSCPTIRFVHLVREAGLECVGHC
jgi:hypothetical protein